MAHLPDLNVYDYARLGAREYQWRHETAIAVMATDLVAARQQLRRADNAGQRTAWRIEVRRLRETLRWWRNAKFA